MAKPACIPCECFFRPHKTGAYVMECMPASNDAPPGRGYARLWDDYKLWMCDLWRCEGCGTVIATGWGRDPVSEHCRPDFNDQRERATTIMGGAIPRIYDC